MVTQTGPIKRGLVRRLRSSNELVTSLVGGIHQRAVQGKVRYPHVIYLEVSSPITRIWGGNGDKGTREIKSLWQIEARALNAVDAENIDQLIDNLFEDGESALDQLIDGQTVKSCGRVSSIPDGGPDRDLEGRRYYRVGGTYEILTDQPIT